MSDVEEDSYCFFGKPLEPYNEDSFPKKKPISVEEQVATDAQGRRRFHGAFTGGFSAGFYNTVGSLEGWTPSEFKSTRQDKAHNKSQKPEDFMDDEDMGEFGIAPQTVRATSDYSTSKKRKRQVFGDGPIPGEPVLHSILSSGNETIGYLLLKNIGLKNKKSVEEDMTKSPEHRVYGCEMPKTYEISRDEDINQYPIHDIYKEYLKTPKSNSFGLGYVGLDKSHVSLFKSVSLVVNERNKKKLSISGQAFGVGAFEHDDEDIYVKDDMSRYDFELTSEKSAKSAPRKNEKSVFDDFVVGKTPLAPQETFLPPTIPHSFSGKHKVKKSRFEPLREPEVPERSNMNPEIRAKYLGEEAPSASVSKEQNESVIETKAEEKPKDSVKKEFLSALSWLGLDRFVSASNPEDVSNILETVQPSAITHGTQEMRDAARMKMFGPLTRVTFDWAPSSLLCKRFNVPEPRLDGLDSTKNKKRTRNLIFEYEKHIDVNICDFKPGLSTKESDTDPDNTRLDASGSDNRITQNAEVINIADNVNETELDPSKGEDDKATSNDPPKDMTEKIHIDKNVDLFRAVFLSSSESESEDDEKHEDEEKQQEKIKSDEMKVNILSDSLLLPKIKATKEGILSNMDFSLFNTENATKETQMVAEKAAKESSGESSDMTELKNEEISYGPVLPKAMPSNRGTESHVKRQKEYDSDDEWVEASDKRHKKSKKHKSKKSSHKKKHKRKRD